MKKTAVAPYGFWESDWSSEQAAAASRDFAQLRAGLGGLVWLVFDPADGRSPLWHWTPERLQCLTPSGISVRSRVYEYGGGAFCVGRNGLAFVNEADQQLYWQALGAAPQMLTQRPDCRYGDLHFDAWGGAVIAIEESHVEAQVTHRLVSIPLGDGAREVLAEGCDFYAAEPERRWPAPGLDRMGSPAATLVGDALMYPHAHRQRRVAGKANRRRRGGWASFAAARVR